MDDRARSGRITPIPTSSLSSVTTLPPTHGRQLTQQVQAVAVAGRFSRRNTTGTPSEPANRRRSGGKTWEMPPQFTDPITQATVKTDF